MNWKERAAVFLTEKAPLPVPPKPPKAEDQYFCQFSQYRRRPISENINPVVTSYQGFTVAELETEAADDWHEIQHDAGQLEAFAHALKTTRTRQQGERPDHYTKAAECAACGPVWLWEGASDKVQGCPWCLNSGPVPHPGPVLCRDCNHWIPDTINPLGGLGKCGKNVTGLAWPTRQLNCEHYQEMAWHAQKEAR